MIRENDDSLPKYLILGELADALAEIGGLRMLIRDLLEATDKPDIKKVAAVLREMRKQSEGWIWGE